MEYTIKLPASAKINLLLDVTGRRADGYHTITGIMQAVSLADVVTLTLTDVPGAGEGGITLTWSCPSGQIGWLPTDRRNIAYKAAEAFAAAAGLDLSRYGLIIDIEKNIPSPAGLAGGSADAAAVLRGLNRLAAQAVPSAILPEGVLYAIAARLGADVPFCLHGGACVTEGIGDALTAVPALPDCDIVIACAGEGVSTPAAYRELDALYGGFADGAYAPQHEKLTAMKTALAAGSLSAVGDNAFNLFESVILPRHAEARRIREVLSDCGAVCAMMSGSGPSVFGLFAPGQGSRAAEALRAAGFSPIVCRPAGEDEA